MFWRKRSLTSEEYEDLSSKIVKLRSDIELLKAEGEKVEERIRSFHGRLNKRIKEQAEEDDEYSTGNNGVDLQELQRQLLGMGNRGE